MTERYILYGMAGSLYTAKVRAYLRRNLIPFDEQKAGGERFLGHVVPKIRRWIIPVIETPDGELLQDGTDILDHFERGGFSENSIYPETPITRAAANLFELFGNEGLLRPAMHYRWNFDDVNLPFLRNMFRDVLPNGLSDDARKAAFDQVSGRMRKVTEGWGVTPQNFAAVEESYADFLARFDAHLRHTPFLLGGHPTIGDYALLGPLYPHLGRDPAPLHLMQQTAPHVFRWTERMNMPETFIDEETVAAGGKLFADDAIPETLKSLMRFVAAEYLPEITAQIAAANDWLTEHSEIAPGTSGLENPATREICTTTFNWRGQEIGTSVFLYRFYLLQRLQDAVQKMDEAGQKGVRALFAETGLEPILELKASRRVERKNYLEVWG
ncbi:MAG: glutathione S-transferase family protein [Sphingorhabdus sp.]